MDCPKKMGTRGARPFQWAMGIAERDRLDRSGRRPADRFKGLGTFIKRLDGAEQNVFGGTPKTAGATPALPGVPAFLARSLLLIILISAARMEMSGAVAELRSFHRQTWTTEHGLPANHITALCQTRDGYLWLGTYFGLARFDGVRFTTFNQGNTAAMAKTGDAITSLVESRDGALCVGTLSGLLVLQDGIFVAFGVTNGLPHDKVLSLFPARDGGVWVGTERGLGHFRKGEGKTIGFPLLTGPIDSVLEGSGGEVWAGTRKGLVRFHPIPRGSAEMVRSISSVRFITQLVEDSRGVVWFNVVGSNHVYQVERGQVRVIALPVGVDEPNGHASEIVTAVDGVVVFAGGKVGFFKGDSSEWEPLSLSEGASTGGITPHPNPLPVEGRGGQARSQSDRAVSCALAGADGTFWVGTKDSGLMRFAPQVFRTFAATTPKLANVWSVAARTNDGVWLGSDGGVMKLQADEMQLIPFATAPEIAMATHSVFVDRENNVWAGRGNLGVWKFDGARLVQQFTNAAVPSFGRVFAMTQERDGRMWFGADRGLYRSDGLALEQVGIRQGFAHENVRAIAQAADGILWIGTHGSGLVRMSNKQCTTFTTSNGLAHDQVHVIREDEARRLWIGTENGLSLFVSNRWFTLRTPQGLFDNVVNHIEEDAFGRMWFSCNRGVYWITKAELLEVAAGTRGRAAHVAYGERDGMLTSETNGEHQPAGCKDSLGRIWFPTRRGVVRVDSAAIPQEPKSPNVIIESIVSDGEIAYHDLHSPIPLGVATIARLIPQEIRLPPGRGRFLEVQFTAPVFEMSEKVRFEYRLEGHDGHWIEATGRRSAYYTSLRPGAYRFRVRACNSRGVWNEAGAAIALELAPRFSETWLFRVLCASGVAAAGFGFILYRLRVQKRVLALERDAALEHQRSRIAQDMHDELGASLTKIAILSEVAKRELERKMPAAGHIDAISETAREVVDGLGQIVWTVNPSNDTLESLCAYLREYAGEFFERTAMACEFDIPMELPEIAVTAEFRRNTFLAAKEILTNVARHSKATHVQVRIRAEPDADNGFAFTLQVTDDGRGFDPEHLPRFSNGIESVRKRIADLGGTVTITSAAGTGTVVTLTLALPSRFPGDG
jgi:ligand-binding sensor domain-containing protein/signal transduction histidine kinase